MKKHGKCAKYTLRHTAKKLECVWKTENRILASKLEYAIKQLAKPEKEELIKKHKLDKISGIEPNSYQWCRRRTLYKENKFKTVYSN